jgi:hypothetical protein
VETFARRQAQRPPFAVALDVHFQNAGQKTNRLILDHVILVAQRLAFVNVENLADIALGVRPDDLVAPGFLHDFARIGPCGSHSATDDNRFPPGWK